MTQDSVFWTSKQEAPLIHSADQCQKILLYLEDRGGKVNKYSPFAPTLANLLVCSYSISSCSSCSLAQVRQKDVKIGV